MLIGSTSFDGFANGEVWYQLAPSLESDPRTSPAAERDRRLRDRRNDRPDLLRRLSSAGLYNLGIYGMRSALRDVAVEDHRALSRTFLHTLVPIAFGYMLAHYFSCWCSTGRRSAISSPIRSAAATNLFGTSNFLINYNLISFAAIWYVQIVAIVTGHVSGLILSHERGLIEFKSPEAAVRSQYWMLAIMVAFTCLALWILSAVTTTTG